MLVAFALAASQAFRLDQTVVYEANLRALGPKVGFASLTRRLDAIQALGTTVLWLMPVQPVGKLKSAGGLGSPYATADFDAVNPEFGTEAELRTLVTEAHRRKIAVLIDWVANHTAWDNPWVKAHPDWYTHDAKGNITIPATTNWQDVADLNFDKMPLREAMTQSMCGWIKRFDLDGFRCDTADWVPFEFWKSAIPKIRASSRRPLLMLAEGFRSDHYAAGFDLTYGWQFYDRMVEIYKGGKASSLQAASASEAKDIPVGARRLRFTTNHDKDAWEGTPAEFFKSQQGAEGAFAVTSLYGGTPLIYTGQEVAWNARIPIFDQSTIDWSSHPEAGRGIARLLALRRGQLAFQRGSLRDFSTDDVIGFERRSLKDEGLVLANVRDVASSLDIPASDRGSWRDGLSGQPIDVGSKVNLAPFQYRVLVRG